MQIRAAVLVVSDRISAGVKEDQSGEQAVAELKGFADVAGKDVVPDDYAEIRRRMLKWCEEGMDLVFTIGGTGLSPRDVTPEATRSILEREVPGLISALLLNGLLSTPRAMLSRAVAGVRGRTLIINLPGSPSAVQGSIEYLQAVLPHAIETIRGEGRESHETR